MTLLNSLLFLSCLTFQSSAAASVGAKTINGHITCDNVVRSVGLSINEDGSYSHDTAFLCVVDPVYTSAGTNGVRLKLSNLPSTFERDWKSVTADGKDKRAGLNLREVVIGKGGMDIRLPDRPTTMVALEEDVFSKLSLQGAEQCDVPLLSWKTDSSSTGDFPSESNGDRNLAVNQSGVKTVLVVRISTSTHGAPQKTAAEMSAAVFSGDPVTMQSQYAACSYGELTFQPATNSVNGLTFTASGVVDIDLTTTSTTYTDEIENLARVAIGTSTSDGALVGVDHIIYVVVSLMTIVCPSCFALIMFCVANTNISYLFYS